MRHPADSLAAMTAPASGCGARAAAVAKMTMIITPTSEAGRTRAG